MGGKLGQYDANVFHKFIKEVEWAEEDDITMDQRAVRGHLPLGMYVWVELETSKARKWCEKNNLMELRTKRLWRKECGEGEGKRYWSRPYVFKVIIRLLNDAVGYTVGMYGGVHYVTLLCREDL